MWSEELVSEVNRLTYDFDSFTGELFMPSGCCCDKDGCIALFQRIDPDVQMICTYVGEKLDTYYRREGQQWRSIFQLPGGSRTAHQGSLKP
jgi:hypothetical protein